jgi:hypothetical protein
MRWKLFVGLALLGFLIVLVISPLLGLIVAGHPVGEGYWRVLAGFLRGPGEASSEVALTVGGVALFMSVLALLSALLAMWRASAGVLMFTLLSGLAAFATFQAGRDRALVGAESDPDRRSCCAIDPENVGGTPEYFERLRREAEENELDPKLSGNAAEQTR